MRRLSWFGSRRTLLLQRRAGLAPWLRRRGHRQHGCCHAEHHRQQGCGCGGHPFGFHRRFSAREEEEAALEQYLKDLEAEAKGVRERLTELRGLNTVRLFRRFAKDSQGSCAFRSAS